MNPFTPFRALARFRPTAGTGRGYSLVGHHELMIPLLASALVERDALK